MEDLDEYEAAIRGMDNFPFSWRVTPEFQLVEKCESMGRFIWEFREGSPRDQALHLAVGRWRAKMEKLDLYLREKYKRNKM